jgi:TPR repeat protein
MDMNLNKLRDEANDAYNRRDFKTALPLFELLAKEGLPEGIYTSALIFENGWHGSEPDLHAAEEFFSSLAIKFNEPEGYLGLARIILKKGEAANLGKAENYCRHVIAKNGDPIAYLLLGRIYEELAGSTEYARAKANYFRAGLRGSAFAWRRYAFLQAKMGNGFAAALAHIFATLVSPVILIARGLRATRRG